MSILFQSVRDQNLGNFSGWYFNSHLDKVQVLTIDIRVKVILENQMKNEFKFYIQWVYSFDIHSN